MAIHYDAKSKRFRDERGRMVAKDRAMRSSVARQEFAQAQKKAAPAKLTKVKLPTVKLRAVKAKVSPAKPKPKAPKAPKAAKAAKSKTREAPPWEREGVVREYPAPDEWYPEVDFYDYDDLSEDWGDYDDEDTDS